MFLLELGLETSFHLSTTFVPDHIYAASSPTIQGDTSSSPCRQLELSPASLGTSRRAVDRPHQRRQFGRQLVLHCDPARRQYAPHPLGVSLLSRTSAPSAHHLPFPKPTHPHFPTRSSPKPPPPPPPTPPLLSQSPANAPPLGKSSNASQSPSPVPWTHAVIAARTSSPNDPTPKASLLFSVQDARIGI